MRGRIRAALATLSTAPWRRAPLLLWRRPGVLATVAGACAVVSASVAAVPLFLSSVGTATVAVQAAERCPRATGATFSFAASPAEVRDPPADPFAPVADRLGPSNRWVRLERLPLAGADPARTTTASVLVRDGALDHVEVLEGPVGPGIWLPDRATERTGLRPGDTATIGGVEVPVAGVYRDLAGTAVDDYWCANGDLLLLEVRGLDLVLPPPLVIADESTFAGLMDGMGADTAEAAWHAPLRGDLTVATTRELVDDLACGRSSLLLAWCEQGRPPVGHRRGAIPGQDAVYAIDAADFVGRFLDSSLPFVSRRAAAVQTTVGGGIWPIAGFAALAGVGLVAATGSLWFDRRRREVALLTTRGVSPAAIATKAVLELSLPLVAGAAAGIGIADVLIRWIGPSPVIESGAVRDAAVGGALAMAVSAVTVGVVVAWRIRAAEVPRLRRVGYGALPWEVLLGAATVVSYARLGEWGVPIGRGAALSRVDVVGLLFPVLFLVTAVAVLSRVVGLGVGPLRAISRSWPTPLYLGIRRIARHRTAVLGLVAASAVTAGVLGYAATLNRSLAATLDLKAHTFVGSDVALQVPAGAELPPALREHATEVRYHQHAFLTAGRRESAVVLAIDPATFERAASWDPTSSSTPLRAILQRLAAAPHDGRVPAVVVQGSAAGPAEVGIVAAGTKWFTIEPVATVQAFPGMSKPKATVVVAASAIDHLETRNARTETWIGGDPDETLDVLRRAGVGFEVLRSPADVADRAAFVTVRWTFGFMQSVGISAGLLALGGAAVYLDARRRERLLGYTFMRRMGLSRQQHRRALHVEVAASLLGGCWAGLGMALVAARLAHARVDPVPGFQPDPVLRPALDVVAGFAVASVLVVLVAALLAQRRVDRDDPVEVLRAGV